MIGLILSQMKEGKPKLPPTDFAIRCLLWTCAFKHACVGFTAEHWRSSTERKVLEQLQQRCTVLDPKLRPTAWEVLCLLQNQAQHSVTLADVPRERLEIFSAHPGSTSTSSSSSYTSSSNASGQESRRSSDSRSCDDRREGSGDESRPGSAGGASECSLDRAGTLGSEDEGLRSGDRRKRKRSKKHSKHHKKKKKRRS